MDDQGLKFLPPCALTHFFTVLLKMLFTEVWAEKQLRTWPILIVTLNVFNVSFSRRSIGGYVNRSVRVVGPLLPKCLSWQTTESSETGNRNKNILSSCPLDRRVTAPTLTFRSRISAKTKKKKMLDPFVFESFLIDAICTWMPEQSGIVLRDQFKAELSHFFSHICFRSSKIKDWSDGPLRELSIPGTPARREFQTLQALEILKCPFCFSASSRSGNTCIEPPVPLSVKFSLDTAVH